MFSVVVCINLCENIEFSNKEKKEQTINEIVLLSLNGLQYFQSINWLSFQVHYQEYHFIPDNDNSYEERYN